MPLDHCHIASLDPCCSLNFNFSKRPDLTNECQHIFVRIILKKWCRKILKKVSTNKVSKGLDWIRTLSFFSGSESGPYPTWFRSANLARHGRDIAWHGVRLKVTDYGRVWQCYYAISTVDMELDYIYTVWRLKVRLG